MGEGGCERQMFDDHVAHRPETLGIRFSRELSGTRLSHELTRACP